MFPFEVLEALNFESVKVDAVVPLSLYQTKKDVELLFQLHHS